MIESIKPFGSQLEWRKENEYAILLLEFGADANYSVKDDFTNEKQQYISATSPLMRASELSLDMVKLLIEKGADPSVRIGENQSTPFGEALEASRFDIINYFIDDLEVNVHAPISTVIQKPNNNKVVYFIQDYVVTKLMLLKLKDENIDINDDKKRWALIEKLTLMGVDFKNYDYK